MKKMLKYLTEPITIIISMTVVIFLAELHIAGVDIEPVFIVSLITICLIQIMLLLYNIRGEHP